MESKDVCPICYEDLELLQIIELKPCKHKICQDCKTILNEKNMDLLCPLCRQRLLTDFDFAYIRFIKILWLCIILITPFMWTYCSIVTKFQWILLLNVAYFFTIPVIEYIMGFRFIDSLISSFG